LIAPGGVLATPPPSADKPPPRSAAAMAARSLRSNSSSAAAAAAAAGITGSGIIADSGIAGSGIPDSGSAAAIGDGSKAVIGASSVFTSSSSSDAAAASSGSSSSSSGSSLTGDGANTGAALAPFPLGVIAGTKTKSAVGSSRSNAPPPARSRSSSPPSTSKRENASSPSDLRLLCLARPADDDDDAPPRGLVDDSGVVVVVVAAALNVPPPPPPSPLGANREPAPGGLKTGDAATMGEGSGPGDGAKGDGAKGATTLDVGLNTGDGAAATGAATTGAATDDVVIFVALGVNLAAAAGLDATGDGAKGKGPSETVEAFPEDSMLSVRWSADPGGTAVRTGLRLAIFVMSFSGETTSGVGAAATDAGASPEPRSSRSPPDSHASSAIDSMRRPRWVVPVRR